MSKEAEGAELKDNLRHALRETPIELRAPVVPHDVEGLSTHEAASMLEPAAKRPSRAGCIADVSLWSPH